MVYVLSVLAGVAWFSQEGHGARIVSTTELPSFAAFVQSRGRTYREGSEEYQARKTLYEHRKTAAEAQNKRSNRRWTARVNDMFDWTAVETRGLFGWKSQARPGQSSAGVQVFLEHGKSAKVNVSAFPAEKDWTHLNSLSHIRNQGACGSCWAIAASTTLETHWEHHLKTNRTFSAQQMVSCVPNPQECGGTGGCEGATVELAFDWVYKHGCASEAQVPYAGASHTCQQVGGEVSLANRAQGMKGWTKLRENNYADVMRAVAEYGPVAVSVAADSWVFYGSGIFDGCDKNAIINHAVVLVGYGEDNSTGWKFWNLQNSWGNDWGEHGRIKLLRQKTDKEEEEFCGMDTQPELGSGCKGGPPEVKVCGQCGILYDTVVPNF